MSVQDSEYRRFEQHLAEFFSGRSWPKIGPGIIFLGVFERFETFFSKIRAHSERYRNLLAGIFEIQTFNGNIAFPLSPVFASFTLGLSISGHFWCKWFHSGLVCLMNPWGRLTKYTNNRERKNEKKRGNESKTLREALVALAGARIHVDKSKAAQKLVLHGSSPKPRR